MNITVRPARREDAATLLTLIDALADYERLDRPTQEARSRLLHDGFETEPARFNSLLAWDGDTAVGYSIVFETYSSFLAQPTLYIEDIFVIPDARGKGAGDALFRGLCAEARRRDCGRMEWMCLAWNQLAIDFYKKRGARHMDDWISFRLPAAEFSRIADTPRDKTL